MTKDNIQDLLVTKFYASPKHLQHKLLMLMMDTAPNKDNIVNFLNGKKLYNDSKDFKEGDYVYITKDMSSYPKIDLKYYIENDLIINDLYIRVQVSYINPMTGYVCLDLKLESSSDEKVEVYYGNIPNQKQIKIM